MQLVFRIEQIVCRSHIRQSKQHCVAHTPAQATLVHGRHECDGVGKECHGVEVREPRCLRVSHCEGSDLTGI